jgi:hypothetical protein
MTPPPASAEIVESAEAEIDLVPEAAEIAEEDLELDDTDGVLDLTDRRRVLLQVVFGVDVAPAELDAVFAASSPIRRD